MADYPTPMTHEERLNRQKKLETYAVKEGVERVRKALSNSPLSESKSGQNFLWLAYPRFVQEILKERRRIEGGARPGYKMALLSVDPENLAFVTLKVILTAIATMKPLDEGVPVLGLSAKIGRWSELECGYESAEKVDRRLYDSLIKTNLNPHNAKRRAKQMIAKFKGKSWDEKDVGAKLGSALIDMLQKAGLIEILVRVKKSTVIDLSEEAKREMERSNLEMEMWPLPAYLPMVIPPKPWKDNKENGGYLYLPLSLVKHQVDDDEEVPVEVRGELRVACEAVNAIQETPWRLNGRILKVLTDECDDFRFKKVLGTGGREGKLTSGSAKKKALSNQEIWEVAQRKREAAADRVLMSSRLAMASRFEGEGEFYFPHQIDWRGRAYSVVPVVNPQADDKGRALVEFARGKPLGKRGGYWLSVQLANLHGQDKLSFDDRVRWTENNREAILASVDRPLKGEPLWREADKPWRFLATAFTNNPG